MRRQFLLKYVGVAAFCTLPVSVALGQATPTPTPTATPSPTPGTSAWVFFGNDHRLQYTPDANGNRIMDFSFAGYMGGGVALPTAPVQVTLSPSGGDDTTAIQGAINTVSALPLDSNGFRGTVLLSPGAYNVSATLTITASGVILRGSGTGSTGTIITMTGPPFLFLSISGSGSAKTSGTAVAMTDPYVPSGATSFNVSDTSGFSVGDTVFIRRPVTAAWIHLLGMDTLVRNGAPQTWISPGSTITTDRMITAIDGNQITLDVPLTDSFDSVFLNPPGGSVVKYTFPGRISQVGAENFTVIAHPQNVDITQPQFQGMSMNATINAWMRDVIFQDTQNTFQISGSVKQLTLDNINVKHTVQHTGDGPADFGIDATQAFLNKCSVTGQGGTWAAVTQSRVTGPIALLHFSADDRGFDPHQRWATGLLCDNCSFPNSHTADKSGVAFSNRGNLGSGQGWDAGWGVAWNTTATTFLIQQPPGAQNFCIGCSGRILTESRPGTSTPLLPNGIYDSFGLPVLPSSLYLEQLFERLGPQAVINIGYLDYLKSIDSVPPTTTAAISPAPNANGWNNSDATVTLTSTDNQFGTGVQQLTFSATGAQPIAATTVRGVTTSFTVTTEGTTTASFFGMDFAQNAENPESVVVKLDKTPPAIAGSATPMPNVNGWNNTDVTVGFACSDAVSGLAAGSPPPPTVLSAEGMNEQVTGTCQDLAGNSASATVAGINIDKTPPVLTAALAPPANANGWNNTDVTVTFTAADVLSGVASVSAPVVLISDGQGQAVTGVATDRAGNGSSLSVSVNIDKISPEAFNQFDPATHDVVLFGRDALSGVAPGPITPTSVVVLSKDDDDDRDDRDHGKNEDKPKHDDDDPKIELRTYTVTDIAGNPLVLIEKVRTTEHHVSVHVVSLQYGTGPVIKLPRNRQSFEWETHRDGSLRTLDQQFEVGTERHEQEISAHFSAKHNRTVIHDEASHGRIVKPGLVLLQMTTSNGNLVVQF